MHKLYTVLKSKQCILLYFQSEHYEIHSFTYNLHVQKFEIVGYVIYV